MEEAIQKQQESTDQIKQDYYDNFRKLEKTCEQWTDINQKNSILEQNWRKFIERDRPIQNIPDYETSLYAQKKIVEIVHEAYKQLKEFFLDYINQPK